MRTGARTGTPRTPRFGRPTDEMPFVQYGMAHGRPISTMRAQIPASVTMRRTKVDTIKPGKDQHHTRPSTGGRPAGRKGNVVQPVGQIADCQGLKDDKHSGLGLTAAASVNVSSDEDLPMKTCQCFIPGAARTSYGRHITRRLKL